MAWEPQAQNHIESQPSKFGFVEDDVYYGGPILAHLHASDTPRGYPDVYVNGEDVTVTIDPLKNAQWNLPHNSERHSFSIHRGALKDHKAVMDTIPLATHAGLPAVNFTPHSKQIDAMNKYTPRCADNSTRGPGRHGPNWGKLPVISQGLYQNAFGDTPDWMVERDVNLMSTHFDRRRFFDYGGGARGTSK